MRLTVKLLNGYGCERCGSLIVVTRMSRSNDGEPFSRWLCECTQLNGTELIPLYWHEER